MASSLLTFSHPSLGLRFSGGSSRSGTGGVSCFVLVCDAARLCVNIQNLFGGGCVEREDLLAERGGHSFGVILLQMTFVRCRDEG